MIELNKPKEKLSYESYCRLRQGGEPASEVYQVWKEHQLKQNSMDIYQMLGDIITGIMVFTIVAGMLTRLDYMAVHPIWITSPSGNTTRQLPLSHALRIIRKRQWRFTSVTPVTTKSPISRKNALKILLLGNKHNGEEL